MGSIGMTELLMFAGIALVVIGPEKFPEFAKIAAKMVREFRGFMNEAKTDIAKEFNPLKKEMNQLQRLNPEDYIEKWASAGDDEKSTANNGNGSSAKVSEAGKEPDPYEGYNPEPEGPTVDGTFSYGSFAGQEKKAAGHEVSDWAPPADAKASGVEKPADTPSNTGPATQPERLDG